MKEKHLSDIDIQKYILKDPDEKTGISAHIQSCARCKARAEIYRQLFTEIKAQPKPAFDFDLQGLVLSQIGQPKPTFSWGAFLVGLLVFAGIGAMGGILLMLRKYFTDLFSGFPAMLIFLLITATVLILLFQGIEIYSKYQRRIDSLKYY